MITINGKQYKELRCSNCQRLIVYQNVAAGILCYICPKCEQVNEFLFKYLKNDENTASMDKDYSLDKLRGGEIKNG